MAGAIATHQRDEEWTLSHTGNWDTHKLDLNGDLDFSDAGELNVSDIFNAVNELTVRSGTSTAYDAAGNMTDDARDYTYVYDAWGRLRQVKTRGGSPTLVAEYSYNGLNYRIGWHYDSTRNGGGNPDGTVDSYDPWFYFCYNDRWQLLATFRGTDSDPKERFVYHAAGMGGLGGSGSGSYIDDVISVNRDESGAWPTAADGTLEVRRYYCQNWRHDVALVATDMGKLIENVKYFSNGVSAQYPAGDVDGNRTWDSTDAAAITGSYDVDKDTNMDGTVDASDITQANNAAGGGYLTSALPLGTLSMVSNRKGYAGYELDPILAGSKAHVRNRVLDEELGRWMRRDPIGNVDGSDLYAYGDDQPLVITDPTGLIWWECGALGNNQPGNLTADECKCCDWYNADKALYPTAGWTLLLPPCPCKLTFRHKGTTRPSPDNPDKQRWHDPSGASPTYHPGARWCMRSIERPIFTWPEPDPVIPPGQQCCYDNAGNLITDGPGAGTPDLQAPMFPFIDHYMEDVLPWKWCKATMLDKYLDRRPPNKGPAGAPCPSNGTPPPASQPCPGSGAGGGGGGAGGGATRKRL